MSTTEHDDDWRAFLYLAREMSAEETAAFELQLAQSQVAREALARAVRLTGTVAAACRPISVAVSADVAAHTASQRSWHRLVTILACAALVLVAVTFGLFDQGGAKSPGLVQQRSDRNVDGLVALWTESSRDAHHDEEELASADFDPNSLAFLDSSELSVPSWMLAAVAGDAPAKNPAHPTEKFEND